MLKKAFQAAATFGLLWACYVGYGLGFAILAEQFHSLAEPLTATGETLDRLGPSFTEAESRRLAVEAFGAGHWSASSGRDKVLCLNDTNRGYWFYAGGYTREGDGRRVTFSPFAMVLMSKNRKSYKTISGREAVLDFNEPFGLGKPGGKAAHVVHARVTDEVMIRDNRGTPLAPADDLVLGPLTYLEFDEHDQQIRSTSAVALRDRNMTTNGTGLLMELRPPDGPGAVGGFNGVRVIWLLKEVRIHLDDAGKSGILPINAPDTAGKQVADAKSPLDLDCAGPMRIMLPEPVAPVAVGPPAPPGPTYARFEHDVRVRRGADTPKQLNCDTFLLTFVPAEKPAPDPAAIDKDKAKSTAPAGTELAAEDPADAGSGGPLSELTLRRAEADGHAVWLQSPAERLKIRCNQLVHERPGGGLPDVTYLRGDKGPKLHMEKEDVAAEGKDKGKVRSFSMLEAIDATIYQDAAGGSRIIARGPGWLESRPARNQPVEREATWQHELVMETKPHDVDDHRIVTLTGHPTLKSPTQGRLDAVKKLILCLVPTPKPTVDPEKAEAQAIAGARDGDSSTGGYRIQWLQAFQDVHMVSAAPVAGAAVVVDGEPASAPVPPTSTPAKRTMRAKDWLYVKFEAPAEAEAPAPVAEAVAPPTAMASAAPAKPASPAEAESRTPAEPKPPEPDMEIEARQVWARVEQRPGDPKTEVREVRLRNDVTLHQGPAPGKVHGTDASGDAIDLLSAAPGRARLLAHGPEGHWAKVITEGSTIEGPVLGLDQATDYAWVNGPGRLTQLADRNALAADQEKEKGGEKPANDAKPAEKRPVVVTWREAMEFHGRTLFEDTGRVGPAQARFYGNPVATMDDSRISAKDELDATMDKPISFVHPKRNPNDPNPEAPEPKPRIVALHATRGVEVSTRKVDPETGGFLELQRINGEEVEYDRTTGNFWVEGRGLVRLYDLADKPNGPAADAPPPLTSRDDDTPRDPKILLVADRRAARAAGNGEKPKPKPRPGPRPPAVPKAKKGPEPDPLMLTQILFHDRMEGQFFGGNGAAEARAGRRESRFFGRVEVLRARVADDDAGLNSDHPPTDLLTLSSKTLRVESQPPPPKSKAKPRNLLRADVDAIADSKGTEVYADFITFDSRTELAFASGMDGHLVTLVQQNAPGQAHSDASGRAAVFNVKTGQGELLEPSQMTLLEGKTGIRFGAVSAPTNVPAPIKPKHLKTLLPSRSSIERRGFTGR